MTLRVGSKGDSVKRLQQALKDKGYSILVDGRYGKGTRAVVVKFQQDNNLYVDGIAGAQTQSVLYGSNYTVKNGVHCIEVDPLDLSLHIEANTGRKIKLKNFINASFVWWTDSRKTKPYPTSLLVYKGKIFRNKQPNGYSWQGGNYPNGAPMPTLIIYNDGTVEVEDKSNFTQAEANNIHLAVSGIEVLPYVRTQGFSPYVPFNTVAYRTQRIGIGYDSKSKKIKLVYHRFADASQFRVHMKNCGCDIGISLDSGGSANFSPSNKTTRYMSAWITWG